MEIFALALLTLLASFIGTLTGFGSSTVMLPVIVLFLPLPVALFFVGIIHTFNDLWKVILFKHAVHWRLLLTFGIPGFVASVVGARVVLASDQSALLPILGIVLLIYVFLVVFEPQFKLPHNTLLSGIGGGISGFLAGTFGVGGPARSMFLSAFNFHKDTYLFTSGAIALFIDIPRLITYYAGGTQLGVDLARGLFIFVPVSFVGAEIAKKFIKKISQKRFRQVIAVFLFLVGLKFIFTS